MTLTKEEFKAAHNNIMTVMENHIMMLIHCDRRTANLVANEVLDLDRDADRLLGEEKEEKEASEEYNNGWIPCSEQLPNDDKKQYIVQKTDGYIDILGFTKDAYKLDRRDFAEHEGKKKQLFYDYDREYGYIEYECVAWQPIPEPYKE